MSVELQATYVTRQDKAGVYYPILLQGRMIAYAIDIASAQMIVAALNLSNQVAFANTEQKPGPTH